MLYPWPHTVACKHLLLGLFLLLFTGTDSLASLEPNTLTDLKLQFKLRLKSILTKYAHYVSYIRQALKKNGVSTEDLRSDLLAMPATNLPGQDLTLFSAHWEELMKATILNDIFDLLVRKYASFLNYDIFQFITDAYHIDHGEDVLKYPEHVKAYLMEHKVSEFAESDTPQKKIDAASKELVLKIDIPLNTEMSRIMDLRSSIAEILGINPTALQLRDISPGCVVVTFLIPTPVAELLFSKDTNLTKLQKKQIRTLLVQWMQCNSRMFNFPPEVMIKEDVQRAENM